jgi:integrase
MQHGSLRPSLRRRGPAVWDYRWREYALDGTCTHRRYVIGNVEQYPDKISAAQAVTGLQREINIAAPHTALTLAEVIRHFTDRELGTGTSPSRSFSTIRGYKQYLKKWILPHWGKHSLDAIQPISVESWMRDQKLGLPTAAKIRSILHLLFNHACRYAFFDHNPIRWVRVRKKRKEIPDILTFDEAARLLNNLQARERLMVLLALGTGLRKSELFALKWKDIDSEDGQISVKRSIVCQVVGHCKTENSRKPVEIDSVLVKALLEWRAQSKYAKPDDWVFASHISDGAKPYWSAPIMKCRIQPAAKRAGIEKKIGWHTFRRTFASWHKMLGTDVKVLQEMMRHSSILTTLDTYAQGMRIAKRVAQNALMTRLLGPSDENQVSLANHVSEGVQEIEHLLRHTATTLSLLIQSLAPAALKPGAILGVRGSP